MDVLQIAKVALQRWYVVVPVLLLTAVAVYLVGTRIPPEYQAQGSVLIQEAGVNVEPVAGSVLAERMGDGQVRAYVKALDGDARYEVEAGEDDTAILTVSAQSQQPSEAVQTVRAALDEMPRQLNARQNQEEIPNGLRRGLEVLNLPSDATRLEQELDDPSPPTFRAEGSARLTEAQEIARLGGDEAREVLVEVLRSDTVERQLLAADDTLNSYAIETGDDEPFIEVISSASTDDGATTLVRQVADRAQELPAELQQLVGWQLEPLVLPDEAELQNSGLLRSVVAVAAVGFLLALGLALLVESIADARRHPGTDRRPPGRAMTLTPRPDVGASALGDLPPVAEGSRRSALPRVGSRG